MEELEKKEELTPEQTDELMDVEALVKKLFEDGLSLEETLGKLKALYEEKKLTEDDYKKGEELANRLDKELASKQFGVDIL